MPLSITKSSQDSHISVNKTFLKASPLDKKMSRKDQSFFSDFLFYLVVFLGIYQFRYFWKPDFSFLSGFFIEYNGFFLSSAEALLILLGLINYRFILCGIKRILSNNNYWPLILFLFFLHFALSENFILPIHRLFHFLLWFWFFIYGIKKAKQLNKVRIAVAIFLFAILIQVFIVLIQYENQRSLGLSFLGESIIQSSVLGVAKIESGDKKIVRAYGTQPHPNVLSGLLAVAIILIIFLLNTKNSSKLFHVEQFRGILMALLFWTTLAMALSFSKMNILILVIFLIVAFFYTNKKIIPIIVTLILLGTVFLNLQKTKSHFDLNSKSSLENISLRKYYQKKSIGIIKENPFLGIGLGNFTVESSFLDENIANPWNIQPVHNVYLLAISELGILFFIFCVFLFFKKIKIHFSLNTHGDLFLLNYFILFLLISGLFDHYLYTLSQGMFIFSFSLILFFNLSKLFHVEQFAQIKK